MSLLSLFLLTVFPWQNLQVNQVNALPAHSTYYVYPSEADAIKGAETESVCYLNLWGTWAFEFIPEHINQPKSLKLVLLDSIPVPSCIERYGYGKPFYRNVGYVWKNWYKNNPPYVPDSLNYSAHYQRHFTFPNSFHGKQIILYIGSATSNVQVYINGKSVGYSEDSKLAVEFDITEYVHKGDNQIDLILHRWCDGTYVEDQDFWRLTGLSRELYIVARQKSHISDFFVHADYDYTTSEGILTIDHIEGNNLKCCNIEAKICGMDDNISLNHPNRIKIQPWSAEHPNLYTLLIILRDKHGDVLEVIPQQIGFRRIEIKGRQILVNGEAVELRGINRHETDPDGGYVLSRQRMRSDIELLRSYGFNAVRTCHYPDDPYWYNLCDQYGIYLVAEANVEAHGLSPQNGGEKGTGNDSQFLHTIMQRNQRHVLTMKNHPSILCWSLGNENGEGENYRQAYKWIKQYDPSRFVHYEPARMDDYSDVYCPMYDNYTTYEQRVQDTDKPMFLCEYAHAMGNSMGGFREYWQLFRRYPMMQGGFIWDFADQGLREHTEDGREYFGYAGDYETVGLSDQNFNCNGVFNPDRLPNPHAEEVRWVMAHDEDRVVMVSGDTICPTADLPPLAYQLDSMGFICQLYRGNEPLLKDSTSIRPCFWRAPTDNDYGAKLPEKYILAKNPSFRLTEIQQSGDTLVCHYAIEVFDGQMWLKYYSQDGGLGVTMEMTSSNPVSVFRYGVVMTLNKEFEQLRYLGRGPHENYPDRKSSAARAIYDQTVTEQYFPYIRPQETGYHTDVAWLTLSSSANKLCIVNNQSSSLLGFSALHYTTSSLDDGISKQDNQRHGALLDEQDLTEVHIDSEMMGLGCVNTWGALPLERYRLHKNTYSLSFLLR